MTKEQAEKVFAVLSVYAGAHDSMREDFIANMTQPDPPRKYRFQGRLGFVGNYWSESNQVTCYPQDMTCSKKRIIARTNAKLEDALGETK